MVKTNESSFPPFPNLDNTTLHFDKLNNTELFLQLHGFIQQNSSPVQKNLRLYLKDFSNFNKGIGAQSSKDHLSTFQCGEHTKSLSNKG